MIYNTLMYLKWMSVIISTRSFCVTIYSFRLQCVFFLKGLDFLCYVKNILYNKFLFMYTSFGYFYLFIFCILNHHLNEGPFMFRMPPRSFYIR